MFDVYLELWSDLWLLHEIDCREMRDKRSFWNVKFMDHSANTNGFFTCQIYIYLSGLWTWWGQNIRPMILKPRQAQESASGTVKIQIGGPYLQNFWFSRSRVRLRICISVKSPGNADDVGAGTTLWEALHSTELKKHRRLFLPLQLPEK